MMTLSASTGQLWMAAAGAVAASLMFTVLEWHRPDSRYRAARIGATVLAIVALALLGLHPAWHSSNASRPVGGAMAAVWTTGQPGAPVPDIFALYRVALRGAAAPAGTAVFPDAALLLRRFPDIATVNVFGDGLDAGGIDALRGLRVVFHPPGPGDATPRPAIVFLRCPRTLALGEPLVLQGMVAGLAPATTANLTLATPDGSTAVSSSAPANHDGNSDFTLRAPAPRSIGRFIWRLRLLASSAPSAPLEEDEPLGISVVAPVLPRVLILENSPHFDTADLRRWFTQAGGTMTVRTLVGRDLYRFASSTRDAAPQFAAVDAPLLAGFDLLLADASALAALTPPEGRALVAAVTDAGLGVLTLAGDMPPAPPDASVFPWQLAPALDAPPEDGERLARPSWPGQVQAIDMPIPAAPLVIGPLPGQSALIGDGQGRTLAATVSRGRGQFALSLLHDSGRWLRGSDPAAFSAYWSLLFSRIARPLDGAAGRGSWTIAEGAGAPVFAGNAMTLLWTGAASSGATAGIQAETAAPEDGATLALARDPAEPGRWRGTFWPRRPGWYRISSPGGGISAALDFYVCGPGEWTALSAADRRAATARFAEASASIDPSLPPVPGRGDAASPAACLFMLFLIACSYLWAERRLGL